jgi:1-acyl-sn-glycerol-3-phosphate acyltransferase
LPDHPRRGSSVLQAFGRAGLRLCRWRVDGALPALPKFVVVVAPHTSNWDFVLGVLAMLALDLDGHWLGKHTLFHGPLGALMRALGGEPVDRSQPGDVVEQVAARIRVADRYVLGLSPEGTRRARPWKTGFHRIACAAGVPVVPAWIDYDRRVIGVGAPVTMTGALEDDLARLEGHYDARMARYPAQYVGVGAGQGS